MAKIRKISQIKPGMYFIRPGYGLCVAITKEEYFKNKQFEHKIALAFKYLERDCEGEYLDAWSNDFIFSKYQIILVPEYKKIKALKDEIDEWLK